MRSPNAFKIVFFMLLGAAFLFTVPAQAQILNTGPVSNQPSGTFGNFSPTPTLPVSNTPHYSFKVATCPYNENFDCSDSRLIQKGDFAGSINSTLSVAQSFVILLDINPGDLSWLMILAENGSASVDVPTHSVSSPGTHSLYNSAMWLVRIDVQELISRGLILDTRGYLNLEVVGALHDGTNIRETLRFKVNT